MGNSTVRRLDDYHPISHVSDMLQLLRQGARQYQPEGLARETGVPQVALDNIKQLRRVGLVISQINVRPTGALFLFTTGEAYYTPALRVGGDGRETEILAELAAESGWGDLVELLDCYHAIPQEYEGPLPNLPTDDCGTRPPAPRDGRAQLPRPNLGQHHLGLDAEILGDFQRG